MTEVEACHGRKDAAVPLPVSNISVRNTFVHLDDETDDATLEVDRQLRTNTAPSAVNRGGTLEMDLGGDTSDDNDDQDEKDDLKSGKIDPKCEVTKAEEEEMEGEYRDIVHDPPSAKFSVRNTFIEVNDTTLEVDRQARVSTAPSAVNRGGTLEMDLGGDTSDEDDEPKSSGKEKAQETTGRGNDYEEDDVEGEGCNGPEASAESDYSHNPAYIPTMAGMPEMPFPFIGSPPGFNTCDHGFAEAMGSQAAAQGAWLGASGSMMEPPFQPLPSFPQMPAKTTLVLKNLPLNYRRNMLLHMLDNEGFRGLYNFVYLPIDFNTGASLGYAFVNIVDPSVVPMFWITFDGYDRWMFRSSKVCLVTWCKWAKPHQGVKVLIERFRNSPVMRDMVPDECKPALFLDGVRVAFPAPTKKLPEPAKKLRAKKLLKANDTAEGTSEVKK